MTINVLPDEALLEIFAHYVDQAKWIGTWYTLVHVCGRWRSIVFSSTNRLHLQLLCTARTPVRSSLDVWPALPIVISDRRLPKVSLSGVDNIVAALKHHDRVHHMELWGFTSSLFGRFAAVAQEPFPELTYLELLSGGRSAAPTLNLPDSFLGGSAPQLQRLHLKGIPFPPIRKLLLSATNLVNADLWNIPHSGYISVEMLVTCLAAMTNLKSFSLGFRSPRSCPDPTSRRPPPLTRTVLPALTHFKYRGVSESLEDLVARIETPLLGNTEITFFNQLILFIPQLPQFIRRVGKFKVFDQAVVLFQYRYVQVRLSPRSETVDPAILKLKISCKMSEWQLSSLTQLCNWSLPSCSTVERLDIREDQGSRPRWQDDVENAQWLELLHPFTAVKDLYLSKELVLRVALALQEPIGAIEVLPMLQNIFLERLYPSRRRRVREAIGSFITARQSSSHPVTVHY